jgi:hypothetical protein
MKVTILLADVVHAVNGTLYILGGGWSATGPDPSPSALALKIDVPPLDVVLGFNVGPLPLKPNSRYVWRCSIDNRTTDDWQVGFTTRPLQR